MIHNFNAGPGILPAEVLQQSAEAVLNFAGTGLSILEFGHRTPQFTAVMEEARALVKELMDLDGDHEVLFLHGGATTQFMQIPMNLLGARQTAAYADTGVWSAKAIKEGEKFGKVDVVCSSREKNYTCIPKDYVVPNDAEYFHITSNNTIYGTQYQKIPITRNVMIADMSSDIFSRQLDFNRFGLIYAGAQKNMGAAGCTLVVVNKNILGRIRRNIPSIMDYRNHIREASMLNTPPVFAVYVAMLTLRWMKAGGGISAMEKVNDEKARILYEALEKNEHFSCPVEKEDRSKMNVVFTAGNPLIEEQFIKHCKPYNIAGIAGHRSVGGFRASLYNALPLSSVEVLVKCLQEFEPETE